MEFLSLHDRMQTFAATGINTVKFPPNQITLIKILIFLQSQLLYCSQEYSCIKWNAASNEVHFL